MGSTRGEWTTCLGCPGELGNMLEACRAIPAKTIAGLGMRSRQEVVVPTLSRMEPRQTLVDWFPFEPSGS
jgi:hypothetical protein